MKGYGSRCCFDQDVKSVAPHGRVVDSLSRLSVCPCFREIVCLCNSGMGIILGPSSANLEGM